MPGIFQCAKDFGGHVFVIEGDDIATFGEGKHIVQYVMTADANIADNLGGTFLHRGGQNS